MTEPVASALLLSSANTEFWAVLHCSEHNFVLVLLQNKGYVLVGVLKKPKTQLRTVKTDTLTIAEDSPPSSISFVR